MVASKFPGHRTNKTIADSSYRPFVLLSGEFTRFAVESGQLAPIVIADVGARGSFDPIWDVLGSCRTEIGFEPDPEECSRLNALNRNSSHEQRFVPVALWRSKGKETLYITKDASASSLYRPNERYFDRLPQPEPNKTVAQITVETERLDDCRLGLAPGGIDVMKMDVQGAELDVLRGGVRTVDENLICVVSEAIFDEQYLAAPVFADLDQFMRAHGFMLVDVDLRRWRRRPLPPQFDHLRMGFTPYADVLYLRDPVLRPDKFVPAPLRREKLLKLAVVAEIYSQIDCSFEILHLMRREELIAADFFDSAVDRLARNRILSYNDRTRMPGVPPAET